MRRKFELLKEMGTNAVRLSHNMPAPEVMELADEMGLLIVTEAFDMWESSKNPYDYARFFPEWYERDVKNWVKRDRNHPSLMMWSIGNEIYDTHVGDKGQYWTRILIEEVRKYDPRNNAEVTIGSNYMPWENAQKCADIVKMPDITMERNIMQTTIKIIRNGSFMEVRLLRLYRAVESIISHTASLY